MLKTRVSIHTYIHNFGNINPIKFVKELTICMLIHIMMNSLFETDLLKLANDTKSRIISDERNNDKINIIQFYDTMWVTWHYF